jgi:hypothetical protein
MNEFKTPMYVIPGQHDELGDYVEEWIKSTKLKVSQLAPFIGPILDLKTASTQSYLSRIRTGSTNGLQTTGPPSEEGITRLSKFLYLTSIPSDHPIVNAFYKDHRFILPPEGIISHEGQNNLLRTAQQWDSLTNSQRIEKLALPDRGLGVKIYDRIPDKREITDPTIIHLYVSGLKAT